MINERMFELANRLQQKSETRQVEWEEDSWNDGYSISFGENRVSVEFSNGQYILVIYNENGKLIDSISDNDIADHFIVSDVSIKKIYDYARRRALRSDELIDDILTSLKR